MIGMVHVSTVLDVQGNKVERWEDPAAPHIVHLAITLSDRSTLDKGSVEWWYWKFVGAIQPKPPTT